MIDSQQFRPCLFTPVFPDGVPLDTRARWSIMEDRVITDNFVEASAKPVLRRKEEYVPIIVGEGLEEKVSEINESI